MKIVRAAFSVVLLCMIVREFHVLVDWSSIQAETFLYLIDLVYLYLTTLNMCLSFHFFQISLSLSDVH